jgi:putative inorganic carbon (HCO3(-)) transporter
MERLAFNNGLSSQPIPDSKLLPANPVPEASVAAPELDRAAFNWLLAFTFILFVRPQDHVPFLRPLHLADFTGTFALIALMASRLGRGAPVTRMTPELGWVLAFGGVMLATAPFSVWPGGAVSVVTDLFSKVIVVFALMVNTLTTRARLERFVGVVVVGTSYVAIGSVANYLRGIKLIEGNRATGAVDGLFGNPNDMALNMVAFLPLAIIIALGRGRPILRAAALIGMPFIGAAIIFSKSRGGLIGLVAMLMVLLYQLRRVRPGIAALVVAASLATVPMLPASFTDRMSSIFNPEEDPTGSREARKRLLRESYEAFLANPLFGLGAGQFRNYNPDERREQAWRESHNAVLQVASELGVMGLIIFIIVVSTGFLAVIRAAALLRRARHRRRALAHDPTAPQRERIELYASAMAASLAGWLMAAMFASVAYFWTFYIVLGIATSLRDIARQELQESSSTAGRSYRARAA